MNAIEIIALCVALSFSGVALILTFSYRSSVIKLIDITKANNTRTRDAVWLNQDKIDELRGDLDVLIDESNDA